jgi:YqaJ-like viral recombinase domain
LGHKGAAEWEPPKLHNGAGFWWDGAAQGSLSLARFEVPTSPQEDRSEGMGGGKSVVYPNRKGSVMETYLETAEELRKIVQNTPEWIAARRGRVTASRCIDIVSKTKAGKYSASRYNYLMEKLSEHITHRAAEHYVTPAMETGIERQPFAQAAYEVSQDCSVDSVGIVVHPNIELFSCSPDGLIGETGIAEYKCPTDRVHLEYLRDGVIPADYLPQMNAELAIMPERQYVDFVSFNPNMPYGMQLFIRRLKRDDKAIAELEGEVQSFLAELAAMMQSLAACKPILEETSV